MTTSRRDFIVGTGAAIALTNLPARAAGDADGAAEKLLAEIAEELLVDYPESATRPRHRQGHARSAEEQASATVRRQDRRRSRNASRSGSSA